MKKVREQFEAEKGVCMLKTGKPNGQRGKNQPRK